MLPGRHAFQLSAPGFSLVSFVRYASSTNRWKARQAGDRFAKEAKLQGLKSRAAFKLLQMDEKYKIFKKGQTVVDLGYAPGSWSQVAIARTSPAGRVLGVDIIPAQPPKGVSTIQGNFLSPETQADIQKCLRDPQRGRPRLQGSMFKADDEAPEPITGDELEEGQKSYIDRERSVDADEVDGDEQSAGRTVDVVLSDMCEPFPFLPTWKRTLSVPYHRMMNTSGMSFRDHAGSIMLCEEALRFSFDVLKTGGHFICKFYQGAEDKALEKQLKALFKKVHREKPEASRSESKESYFVALRRKGNADKNAVFPPVS